MIRRIRKPQALVLAMSCMAVCSPLAPDRALAATPAPAWSVKLVSAPTNFAPGSGYESKLDQYTVEATNIGAAPTDQTAPITLSLSLPGGVSPASEPPSAYVFNSSLTCTSGTTVLCTDAQAEAPIQPGQSIFMKVPVDVAASAAGRVVAEARVEGGGTAAVSAKTATLVTSASAPFGLNTFTSTITAPDGAADIQAGSHPYQLTVGFDLADEYHSQSSLIGPTGDLKDATVDLPHGLIVNPNATAVRCTEAQLESEDVSGGGCPAASAVGLIKVTSAIFGSPSPGASPLYNMVPPPGAPAEFGFDALGAGIFVHLIGSVRTGGDYGLSATSSDVLQKGVIDGISATLWGSPSDPSHDYQRGRCGFEGSGGTVTCPVSRDPVPLLTMPSACSGPLLTTATVDSWQAPGIFTSDASSTLDQFGDPVGVSGCGQLAFEPSISVHPDTTVADSPSGLNVDLHVPQPENEAGLAEANLKDAVVVLPAGMSVSPSAAGGLAGCSEAQIGLHDGDAPSCPDASKIGTVRLTTPLLPDPLIGGVYVAQQGDAGAAQGSNPFGSLLAIYVTAEADGARIKLAGKVTPDPRTGQLTATFLENPQLPFSDLQLSLFGGPQGPLATPEACGTYTTSTDLTPWSGGADATPLDSFPIDSGCASGFSPAFAAGTQNAQAGVFSPFTLSFARSDRDQELAGLSVTLPPGLLAKLADVPLCSSADASAGACPASALVGSVQVAAGPGPDPILVSGGAYLTGPYHGGPYGLAVEVPAVAGPFNLGTVVVRVALHVDPVTAQVTAVSDPLPSILDGVPLRVRRVDVTLDRIGFTFNPTSCEIAAVAGTVSSVAGALSPVSSRFQVGGCAGLPFRPSLTAFTQGNGSINRNGASLTVKITTNQGPSTNPASPAEANIAKVDVQLPLQLPSRLSTLQKACSEKQFAEGPAGCPPPSDVGTARAFTPLLATPRCMRSPCPATLEGPAYLVSHGGRAFPDLDVVLRGDGVTIVLTGHTQITKGITYSQFETVPDAPVSSFELNLPEGPYSVLGAYVPHASLCTFKTIKVKQRATRRVRGHVIHYKRTVTEHVAGGTLPMPTKIVGQNGAVLEQTTKIQVTGCAGPRPRRSKTARTGVHRR